MSTKTQTSAKKVVVDKKNMSIYDQWRPHNPDIKYHLEETRADMMAGITEIHLTQTQVEYEPGQDLNEPDLEEEQKRYPKVKRMGPVWTFWEETQAFKQELRNKERAEEMARMVAAMKKHQGKQQSVEHKKIIKIVGPVWYQELSNYQMDCADELKNTLLKDFKTNTIENTHQMLYEMGIVLRPNHTKVQYALKKFYKCPVEFLLTLYQLTDPNRTSYSLNDIIMLSAIVHLTMRQTLKEIHLRTPSPPKVKPEKPKPPKKKPKKLHPSPYMRPFRYQPQHIIEGDYKDTHKVYPTLRYFDYINDMYDVSYEVVKPEPRKAKKEYKESKWDKPPRIPVRMIQSLITKRKVFTLKKPSEYMSGCEKIKDMKREEVLPEDTYLIDTEINLDNICSCSPDELKKDITFTLNIKITTSTEEINLSQKLFPYGSQGQVMGDLVLTSRILKEKDPDDNCHCDNDSTIKRIEYRCECCNCHKSVDISEDCPCGGQLAAQNLDANCCAQKIMTINIQQSIDDICSCLRSKIESDPNSESDMCSCMRQLATLSSQNRSREKTCTCQGSNEGNEETLCFPGQSNPGPCSCQEGNDQPNEQDDGCGCRKGGGQKSGPKVCTCQKQLQQLQSKDDDSCACDVDSVDDPFYLCTCGDTDLFEPDEKTGGCNCGAGAACGGGMNKPNQKTGGCACGVGGGCGGGTNNPSQKFMKNLQNFNQMNKTNLRPCCCGCQNAQQQQQQSGCGCGQGKNQNSQQQQSGCGCGQGQNQNSQQQGCGCGCQTMQQQNGCGCQGQNQNGGRMPPQNRRPSQQEPSKGIDDKKDLDKENLDQAKPLDPIKEQIKQKKVSLSADVKPEDEAPKKVHEACICDFLYERYIQEHEYCQDLYQEYQDKIKKDLEEYLQELEESGCNCSSTCSDEDDEQEEESEDSCACHPKGPPGCNCGEIESPPGCTCGDPVCVCGPQCMCTADGGVCECAETLRNLQKELKQSISEAAKEKEVEIEKSDKPEKSEKSKSDKGKKGKKGDKDKSDKGSKKEPKADKKATIVAPEKPKTPVETGESNAEDAGNKEAVEPEEEKEEPDPRIYILEEFPKNETEQMELLKKVLADLSADGYPLAKLPDVHTLPHFKLWLDKRSGKYISMDQRPAIHNICKKRYGHCTLCHRNVEVPNLGLTGTQIRKMTWGAVNKYRRRIDETKTDYYRRLKRAYVSEAREFFTCTYHRELPNVTFRDVYFSYLPSDENHIFVIRPWEANEHKDMSKRQPCICNQ